VVGIDNPAGGNLEAEVKERVLELFHPLGDRFAQLVGGMWMNRSGSLA